MAKISKPSEPEYQEHPDDRRDRLEAEELAKKRIDAFLAKLPPDTLRSMILVYADGKADDMLCDLREQFWGNLD